MSYKGIKELEVFPEEKRKTIYKKLELQLYKENRFFLLVSIIGGFFPGLAIIGFIEAYRRIPMVKEYPVLVGLVITAIIIGVWFWKDHFKDNHIASAVEAMGGQIDA